MNDLEVARLKVLLKAAQREVELLRFSLYLEQEKRLADEKRAREEHEKLHARIERLEQQLSRLADLELGVR